MSAQHIPGRLESKTHTYGIADTGDYDSIFEIWGGEKVIAWFGGEDTDEANARRLVACWNACEGIDTEYLEGDESLPHYARRLMTQRDELLATLERYVEIDKSEGCTDNNLYRSAVAAIAKVKGGAA